MWCGWIQGLNRPARADAAGKEHPSSRGLSRIEVCPPARLYRRSAWQDGFREGLREWLNTGWQVTTSAAPLRELRLPKPQGSPVIAVRNEFAEAIGDIRSADADALSHRIQQARSLRELWHLRIEIYTLISKTRDEVQAQSRLSHLNRHFPTRAPRAAFGNL